MVDSFREVNRLENVAELTRGLEAYSTIEKTKDVVNYFFSRFIKNIKHSFSDFSSSEISNFNSRYHNQLNSMFKDPLLNIDDVQVSIPKGMIYSYRHTLDKLIECLGRIKASDILNDIEYTTSVIYTNSHPHVDIKYSKTDFESDKKTIGSLYSQVGLSYSLGKKSLVSLEELKDVNTILLSITRDYYPKIIEMTKLIDNLELVHNRQLSDQGNSNSIRDHLMSLAYRVSIFSVIMEHIQVMEHSFVNVLSKLKEISQRK